VQADSQGQQDNQCAQCKLHFVSVFCCVSVLLKLKLLQAKSLLWVLLLQKGSSFPLLLDVVYPIWVSKWVLLIWALWKKDERVFFEICIIFKVGLLCGGVGEFRFSASG